MSKAQTEHLEELRKRFERFKAELASLKDLNVNMEQRPAPDKWNGRECLEHLVVMWQTYQPQFDKGFLKAKPRKNEKFKSGWFGGWFANRMKPLDGKTGMKTMGIFEPSNYTTTFPAVERLMQVQDELIDYLNKMENIDINRSRIQSPASALISLKMGDAMMILANHQDRHWQQALRAMGEE